MDQMRACVGRCNALDKEVSSLVAAGGGGGSAYREIVCLG
jgi:hypothetical protein